MTQRCYVLRMVMAKYEPYIFAGLVLDGLILCGYDVTELPPP